MVVVVYNQSMSKNALLVILTATCAFAFLYWEIQTHRYDLWQARTANAAQYDNMSQSLRIEKKQNTVNGISDLVERGCVEINITYDNQTCSTEQTCKQTLANTDYYNMRLQPLCMDFGSGHIDTPESVRGIYMTSLAAASNNFRNRLIGIANDTEINSIIIDIKEVDGYVAYSIGETELFPYQKNIMTDIGDLIEYLHEQDIYVIARVVLFKDKVWAENHPEHAVLRKDDPKRVWTDYGGKKFIDPGAKPFWDYIVNISSAAYEIGFDEINADYIRFPSDGNMANTYYPYSQEKIDKLGGVDGRVAVLNEFMEYYTTQLRTKHPDIVISADVFGMVTSLNDDLTIGQKLEPFLTHFDYVAPMVYPSHYPRGFINKPGHPDNYPYEIIYKSMRDGIAKAEAAGLDTDKLRPWLQDFTCTWCAGYFTYGGTELRAQIQATYDSGLDSWWLWNAGNRYSTSGLLKE